MAFRSDQWSTDLPRMGALSDVGDMLSRAASYGRYGPAFSAQGVAGPRAWLSRAAPPSRWKTSILEWPKRRTKTNRFPPGTSRAGTFVTDDSSQFGQQSASDPQRWTPSCRARRQSGRVVQRVTSQELYFFYLALQQDPGAVFRVVESGLVQPSLHPSHTDPGVQA